MVGFRQPMSFSFSKLITFDLANNHFGDVAHGLQIARSIGQLVPQFPTLNLSLKLQYRELDTFFHPDAESSGNPYVTRFQSTRLSAENFREIIREVRKQNLVLGITPFDEVSVDRAVAHGADYLKVASCSGEDWPLLEKIRTSGKPVVLSTGGLELPAIKKIVSFFAKSSAPFALMHCIALYPSDRKDLRLSCIRVLKEKFPQIAIGYSAHETGSDPVTTGVAVGNGAVLFERHIAYPSEQFKNNKYSLLPEEAAIWLHQLSQAWQSSGDGSFANRKIEQQSLAKLQRGVFAKEEIQEGQTIGKDNTFFAFPKTDEQNSPAIFSSGNSLVATTSYKKNEGLREKSVEQDLAEKARSLCQKANLPTSILQKLELSHHYGLAEFSHTGCFSVQNPTDPNVKYLILLPSQKHPNHQHQSRTERFRVLYGEISLLIDGEPHYLVAGQEVTILPKQWHEFTTSSGVVVEETILGNLQEKSVYFDDAITAQKISERKTVINLASL